MLETLRAAKEVLRFSHTVEADYAWQEQTIDITNQCCGANY